MDWWNSIQPYVIAIVPTIGVAALFYVVIKSMIEGDRRERRALAQWEAENGRSLRPHRVQATPPVTGNVDAPAAESPTSKAGESSSTDHADDRIPPAS